MAGKKEKKIDPSNLERLNGAFEDMSSHLEGNVADLISSSATEKLQSATEKLKTLSKEMKETISSLDQFLNAVGAAFRETDASMATQIYTKAPETRAKRRERYIQSGENARTRNARRNQLEARDRLYSDFPR